MYNVSHISTKRLRLSRSL